MADIPDSSDTDIQLSLGGSVISDIGNPDDRDWIALTLEAGETYSIVMEGSGANALGDPYIYALFDSGGQSLGRFDNDGAGYPDARLVYTPGESGTYYVELGSYFLTAGDYRLSLQEYVAAADTPYTLPVAENAPLSGDALTDALIEGVRYQNVAGDERTEVSFSLPKVGSLWSEDPVTGYGPPSGGGLPWAQISYLTPGEESLFRDALAQMESFAALRFQEVADNASSAGVIRAAWTGTSDDSFGGIAGYPGANAQAGDVWFNAKLLHSGGAGSYFGYTMLHELGHAMGLQHPHEGLTLPRAYDGVDYTVMSYNMSAEYHSVTGLSFYPTTYMYLDILALQHLYGGVEKATGNTVYRFEAGESYYETIWDTGGNDTYDASAQSANVTLDLTPGSWSSVGTTILMSKQNGALLEKTATIFTPPEVLIEKAIGGAGSDVITGNNSANSLIGNAGNDTLMGGDGRDWIVGGDGNDSLLGGNGADQIGGGAGNDFADGGAGADTLFGGGGSAETSRDTLLGGSGDDVIYAGFGDDSLMGDSDNDLLGGGEGHDVIMGGDGNDRLFGGIGAAALSHDTLDGGAGDDTLYGGQGNDSMTGGAGDDVIYAGAGDDVLSGGLGRDYFIVGPEAGQDQLLDFEVGEDTLDLTACGFGGMAEVLAVAHAEGNGVRLQFAGTDLFIDGLTLLSLSAADILF